MDTQRKPEWLRIKLDRGKNLDFVKKIFTKLSLNTVCEEANCPNKGECFSKKTATFMILGNQCSRDCRFCNVSHDKMSTVDINEPENVAKAAVELGLNHVVITSVTRDDLPDGGAKHFYNVVRAIKTRNEKIIVELLIPDFQGNKNSLNQVILAKPEIINHNVETVPRLYPEVRPMAIYKRSLELLKSVKELDETIYTKSGIMVGLGEIEEEVIMVLKDLREVGCDFLTIGQYLAPSDSHYPVVEYIHPSVFDKYRTTALEMGFKFVAAAPLVRSSYNAAESFINRELQVD
jgi:lipoic acid synthetase